MGNLFVYLFAVESIRILLNLGLKSGHQGETSCAPLLCFPLTEHSDEFSVCRDTRSRKCKGTIAPRDDVFWKDLIPTTSFEARPRRRDGVPRVD